VPRGRLFAIREQAWILGLTKVSTAQVVGLLPNILLHLKKNAPRKRNYYGFWQLQAHSLEETMRPLLFTLVAATLLTSAALAQTSSQSGPQNPPVKGTHDNNAYAPVAGANSFTMGEARSQIETKGYTNVMHLKKGADGVWRGTATKDGRSQQVSVDYQGNVN
jgi:hypothetical protein